MVRLKGRQSTTNQNQVLFQFQNGAIKSKGNEQAYWRIFSFQFQNGAIKSGDGKFGGLQIAEFQFQNGAIKRSGSSNMSSVKFCFNSKMVRLKEQADLKVSKAQ